METQVKPAKENKKEGYDIVISRLINAPVELVYKAWTEPQQFAQWWGSEGDTNPLCEMDMKVGGKWRVHQKDRNGSIYKLHGEYRELVKNERIVWSFVLEGNPDRESLGIITFKKEGNKTLLTNTIRLQSAAEREGMIKGGAIEGTHGTLGRLEKLLTGASSTDCEIRVSRILNAPKELVWEMWTNPEHIKHWWGPNGFTNTIRKMDIKPGGEWNLIMHGPDGKNYPSTHTYTEVVKYEKLVHRHGPYPVFELSAVFTALDKKTTLLTVISQYESPEMLQKIIKLYGAAEGLKQNIERLENYIVQTPVDNELVIMRQFNAPRELVFKAWTEPERLAEWWGPKGAKISVSRLELKPGGMFLYSMKNPNGQDIWGKFIYHEITPPEKLVFVNSFSDKDGNTTANPWMPLWPLEIMNTVTLIEYGGKTTLTIKGKPINATDEEIKSFESFRDSMQGGLTGTFDQLEEYLTKN